MFPPCHARNRRRDITEQTDFARERKKLGEVSFWHSADAPKGEPDLRL